MEQPREPYNPTKLLRPPWTWKKNDRCLLKQIRLSVASSAHPNVTSSIVEPCSSASCAPLTSSALATELDALPETFLGIFDSFFLPLRLTKVFQRCPVIGEASDQWTRINVSLPRRRLFSPPWRLVKIPRKLLSVEGA